MSDDVYVPAALEDAIKNATRVSIALNTILDGKCKLHDIYPKLQVAYAKLDAGAEELRNDDPDLASAIDDIASLVETALDRVHDAIYDLGGSEAS